MRILGVLAFAVEENAEVRFISFLRLQNKATRRLLHRSRCGERFLSSFSHGTALALLTPFTAVPTLRYLSEEGMERNAGDNILPYESVWKNGRSKPLPYRHYLPKKA
jgi:hypothetical protein